MIFNEVNIQAMLYRSPKNDLCIIFIIELKISLQICEMMFNPATGSCRKGKNPLDLLEETFFLLCQFIFLLLQLFYPFSLFRVPEKLWFERERIVSKSDASTVKDWTWGGSTEYIRMSNIEM